MQYISMNSNLTVYWTSMQDGSKKRNCCDAHADFASRKQNYLRVYSLAMYVCVP